MHQDDGTSRTGTFSRTAYRKYDIFVTVEVIVALIPF